MTTTLDTPAAQITLPESYHRASNMIVTLCIVNNQASGDLVAMAQASAGFTTIAQPWWRADGNDDGIGLAALAQAW